jgi:hexosaminidase
MIHDSPAFAYRGIMIDSARHYLSVKAIKRTLDAMMYNKLNVLHWHITDDESFPLELKSFPQVHKSGAFSKNEVYTKENVADILNHATKNGIRVIPEIDSPGHTRSWGLD